ncbi:hypothetical protein ITP53_34255 [Nonomuraea sp. K274]|uniref:Uncharacterized protein n=1 Tax=Nonomuraea cypriaca TaxID=1187855 RepID=A0A931AGL8_9ACTN|nr:hypothetical protein [Nonomuraea cypriaca]MBF8190689.1 hypothetical protein [Nonomuraea cypriaca]
MGSLLEELARREAMARQRLEEIREQITALESRLEAEQGRLSRLVITRETVEEVLGQSEIVSSFLSHTAAYLSEELRRDSWVAVPGPGR